MGPAGLNVISDFVQDGMTDIIPLLADMGPDARFMIPTLIGFLKSNDRTERFNAAKALFKLDRPIAVRLIVPVLAELMVDRKSFNESNPDALEFITLIEELGPHAAPLVHHLIAYAEDDHMTYGTWAVQILGRLGPAAHDAIPSLQRLSRAAPFGAWKNRR